MAAAAILAGGLALAVAAPFLSEFESFSHGAELVDRRTPLWQLAIVYGHAFGAIVALALLWVWRPDWRDAERSFALILGAAALILIAVPEIVRVGDIYGEDHARANTMFKFSFRAQTLLQVAAVACIAHLAAGARPAVIASFALAAPLIATFSYAEHTFRSPTAIRDLDGLRFLGEERAMVEFVHALPLRPGEAILEAAGESYTEAGRVSAATGKPTPLGWRNHEWLWRDDYAAATRRFEDVRSAYESADLRPACRVLRRHGVRYLVIGAVERALYPEMDEERLRALGRTMFRDEAAEVVLVDPAVCDGP
jgi:uncharacterized membrane protein